MRTVKAVVVALALAASAPAHAEHPLAAYRLLVPGHTIADARAVLGQPFMQTVIAPGQVLVQWIDDRGGGFRQVAIVFSSSGRMLGVQTVAGL